MKRIVFALLLVLLVLGVSSSTGQPAREAGRPVGATRVAVVDYARLVHRFAGYRGPWTPNIIEAGPPQETDAEKRKRLEKRQDETTITIWKDIREAVRAYAATHDIQLVLSYADPVDKKDLEKLANVKRYLEVMDIGGAAPIFVGEQADITEGVAELLNKRFRERKEKTPE